MKSILVILFCFCATVAFSQSKNSDTLFVKHGIYKFIKIGEKVYKINYSLEELPPVNPIVIDTISPRWWENRRLLFTPNSSSYYDPK